VRATFLTGLLLFLPACMTPGSSAPKEKQMGLSLDLKVMKAEIMRHVTIGMPIEDARCLMEKHGFKILTEQDGLAIERDGLKNKSPCLICSRYMPQKSWSEEFIHSDEIRVYLFFEQGKVTSVQVRHIPTCL